MSFTVVIPARYTASRLPGKPLADLGGRPLLQWVYERAVASGAERVVVATDDARIESAARAFGAQVVMTAASHRSGTDRIAEAAQALELPDEAVVVNVQGDEPLLPPPLIRQVANDLLAHPAADMATLSQRIVTLSELASAHAVKVVCDRAGYALYFSRALIPQPRDAMPEAEHLAEAEPAGSATSASTPTAWGFCAPSLAGRRARSKPPKCSSSCARCGTAPPSTWPRPAHRRRPAWTRPRIWNGCAGR